MLTRLAAIERCDQAAHRQLDLAAQLPPQLRQLGRHALQGLLGLLRFVGLEHQQQMALLPQCQAAAAALPLQAFPQFSQGPGVGAASAEGGAAHGHLHAQGGDPAGLQSVPVAMDRLEQVPLRQQRSGQGLAQLTQAAAVAPVVAPLVETQPAQAQ